jgi:hypothetical protein
VEQTLAKTFLPALFGDSYGDDTTNPRRQFACLKAMNLIALGLSSDNKQTILQGKDTGRWLLVLPSTVNRVSSCGMQDPHQIFHLSVTDAMQH